MRLKRPAALNIGVDLDREALDRASMAAGIASSDDLTRGSNRRPSPELASSAEIVSSGGARSQAFPSRSDDGARPVYEFHCRDGISFLELYPFRGNELVYCDPPYVRSTRKGSRDLYRHEMSDQQHIWLLRVLRALNCRVILSGYWSRLYADKLRDWYHTSFEAMTRGGKTATEHLWMNFGPPVELHDYSFLGADFRERERIKRKKQRWTKRLSSMPILERQALWAALASIDISGDSSRSIDIPADATRL